MSHSLKLALRAGFLERKTALDQFNFIAEMEEYLKELEQELRKHLDTVRAEKHG